MITTINEYKRIMENSDHELIKDQVYKIYDRTKGGAIMYSQAKYAGKDDKGLKFELLHIKNKDDRFTWLEEDYNKYSFQPTRDFTTKK